MRFLLEVVGVSDHSAWWGRTEYIMRTVEVSALILAVPALWVAVRHLHELKKVWQSLTTRHIGEFPACTHQINRLISKARSNLTILCDVPAYSVLSDWRAGVSYLQALERLDWDRFTLKFICLDNDKVIQCTDDQFKKFSDPKSWAAYKKKRKKALQRLLDDKSAVERLDIDTLKRALVEKHSSVFASLRRWQPRRLSESLPVHFWIADNREAVFTIPTYNPEPTEIAFVTQDHELIEALLKAHDRYWEMAGPKEKSSTAVSPSGDAPVT
jgi:hypothetical protein